MPALLGSRFNLSFHLSLDLHLLLLASLFSAIFHRCYTNQYKHLQFVFPVVGWRWFTSSNPICSFAAFPRRGATSAHYRHRRHRHRHRSPPSPYCRRQRGRVDRGSPGRVPTSCTSWRQPTAETRWRDPAAECRPTPSSTAGRDTDDVTPLPPGPGGPDRWDVDTRTLRHLFSCLSPCLSRSSDGQ